MMPTEKKKVKKSISADLFPSDVRIEMDALIEQEKKGRHVTRKYLVGAACCLISIFVLFSVVHLPKSNAEVQVMQRINEIREVIECGELPTYIISSPRVHFMGREVIQDFGYDKSTYACDSGTIYLFEQETQTVFHDSGSEILAEGIAQTMDHKNVEYYIDLDGCTAIFESQAGGSLKLYTVTAPQMDKDSFLDIVNSITISDTK